MQYVQTEAACSEDDSEDEDLLMTQPLPTQQTSEDRVREDRYAITSYYLPTHELTQAAFAARQLQDVFLYPDPDGQMSANLLRCGNMVLTEILSQELVLRAMPVLCWAEDEMYHGQRMQVAEVRLRWPTCDSSKGSHFKLQLHLRLAVLDEDGLEVVRPQMATPSGCTEEREFREFWLYLKKGGRKGRMYAATYMTDLRRTMHTGNFCDEEDAKHDWTNTPEPVNIDAKIWEHIWSFSNWLHLTRQASQQASADVPTESVDDNFVVSGCPVRICMQQLHYYVLRDSRDENAVHHQLTNFVFLNTRRFIQWEDQDGVKRSCAEISVAYKAQVRVPQCLRFP